MMNLIFLILSTYSGNAQTIPIQLFKDGKYETMPVKKYNNLRISENCFKNKIPKCAAFDATKKKAELSKPKTNTIGNPAARYCHDLDGLNKILVAKDQKQYDYCVFNDGSMIDSWDLYYARYPNDKIK